MTSDAGVVIPATSAPTFCNTCFWHTRIRAEFVPLRGSPGLARCPSQRRILQGPPHPNPRHGPMLALQTAACLYSPITALVSDSSDYVVCPWSTLLSAAGSLSFQDHSSHGEAAPFKAPELLQGQSDEERPDASRVRRVASLQRPPAPPPGRPVSRTSDLSWWWHPLAPSSAQRNTGQNEF